MIGLIMEWSSSVTQIYCYYHEREKWEAFNNDITSSMNQTNNKGVS